MTPPRRQSVLNAAAQHIARHAAALAAQAPPLGSPEAAKLDRARAALATLRGLTATAPVETPQRVLTRPAPAGLVRIIA